jgi:integrase
MANGMFLTHLGCLTPLAKKTEVVLSNVRNVQSARIGECSSQTINKSLKILSTALHLAHDEEVIANIPKINYLPEDGQLLHLVEQYNDFVRAAENLRGEAALLPEAIEILGEFGLRPGELFHLTWQSIDWELGQGENKGAIKIEEQKRTRVVGGKKWVPKNKKFRIVPFTARGRAVLLRIKEMALWMRSMMIW